MVGRSVGCERGPYIFAYSVVVWDPVADVLISVPAFANKYALLASLEPSFIRFTSLVDEALSISSPFSPSLLRLSVSFSLSLRVCRLFLSVSVGEALLHLRG
jgi:hypothetical protein